MLVTGPDQSRAAVAAVRLLAAAGYRPAVTHTGRTSLAAASRHCRRRVRVPSAELDPDRYRAAIEAESAARGYLAVLPGSDPALRALGRPEARFTDKLYTARRAAEAGIETPPTRVFDSYRDLLDAGGDLDYPIVVKPDVKRFLAQRVDRREELSRVPDGSGRLVVQPFLGDDLHGIIGLTWQGRLIAATRMRYLRIWPRPAGTVAAAVTIERDPVLEARLEQLLADHDGLFHADLIGPYLLDLNPRIHAALPLAAAAGSDVIRAYGALLEGREPRSVRGRAGVRFRWIEGDLRSLIHQVRRGRISIGDAVRWALPRPGTVHGLVSVQDPGPCLARLRFLPENLEVRRNRRREERRRAALVARQAGREPATRDVDDASSAH